MTSPARVPSSAPARVPSKRSRTQMSLGGQLRALSPLLAFGGLLLVATTALIWFPMQQRADADPSLIVRALLGAQLFRIEIWFGPLLVLCASVGAIVALVQAKRRARSVAILKECVSRLAVGDAEPVSFARGDELRGLEAPLTGISKRIDQLKRDNLELLRVLRHNLDGLMQRASSGNNTDMRESFRVLIRDIDSEIKKLQMRS